MSAVDDVDLAIELSACRSRDRRLEVSLACRKADLSESRSVGKQTGDEEGRYRDPEFLKSREQCGD